jgi:hypothetical protein
MQAKHEENLQALLVETRQNLEWLSAVSIVPEVRKRPAEAVQVCGRPFFPTVIKLVFFFFPASLANFSFSIAAPACKRNASTDFPFSLVELLGCDIACSYLLYSLDRWNRKAEQRALVKMIPAHFCRKPALRS